MAVYVSIFLLYQFMRNCEYARIQILFMIIVPPIYSYVLLRHDNLSLALLATLILTRSHSLYLMFAFISFILHSFNWRSRLKHGFKKLYIVAKRRELHIVKGTFWFLIDKLTTRIDAVCCAAWAFCVRSKAICFGCDDLRIEN